MTNENKLDMLDKLIDMYPHLEMEKNKIISECIEIKKDVQKNTQKNNKKNNKKCKKELVLDKVNIKNKIYYIDSCGGIWNKNAELVGTTKKIDNKIEYIFY